MFLRIGNHYHNLAAASNVVIHRGNSPRQNIEINYDHAVVKLNLESHIVDLIEKYLTAMAIDTNTAIKTDNDLAMQAIAAEHPAFTFDHAEPTGDVYSWQGGCPYFISADQMRAMLALSHGERLQVIKRKKL